MATEGRTPPRRLQIIQHQIYRTMARKSAVASAAQISAWAQGLSQIHGHGALPPQRKRKLAAVREVFAQLTLFQLLSDDGYDMEKIIALHLMIFG